MRKTNVIIIILLTFFIIPKESIFATTDYPYIFPSKNVLFSTEFKKDLFFINSGFAFSFWGKKLPIKQPTFDKTSYITTPKIINYAYNIITQSSDEGQAQIKVSDFDVYIGGEYFFSDSIFTNLGVFLRSRDFNNVSGFGFGDININLIFRFTKNPELYGSFGALIPLAGEPDEQIATFQRINQSSFGLDFPIYTLLKIPFETENLNIAVLSSGGYIFRMSYPFFGQIISPGDVALGSIGITTTLKNFFQTSSDISHNFAFGLFSSFIHGFPEDQRTSLYRVPGSSWDVIKSELTLAGKFKTKKDIFGEKIIREWLNLSLHFSFVLYERSFLKLDHPDYAIIRFPYIDRIKPGFYSSINLTFIFY
ncbi:MAG: hypothetical protein NZ927_00620 [Candidatus Calescibacterium sp.]|nr:hypothetical protein [Candidatus Calescibacterium sp.]MCX7733872.1 hypothetical protein [bacterium]MDW8086653.1 hypothetical protein [Candidatus Calescibacterium sp.]